jgi:YHS domain-containing protein
MFPFYIGGYKMVKRYKVYLNIDESEFIHEDKGIKYFFSSEFNLMRFSEKVDDFIKEQSQRINIKYTVPIDLKEYLKIVLYTDIEKRGFRIETPKGVINSWQKILFVGEITTKKN